MSIVLDPTQDVAGRSQVEFIELPAELDSFKIAVCDVGGARALEEGASKNCV